MDTDDALIHEPRLYPKAPIKEAVLELRVEPSGTAGGSPAADEMSRLFPEFTKSIPMQHLHLSIGAEGATRQTQTQLGLRLSNEPETRVLQIKNDGFAYSSLAPYPGWEAFRNDAMNLWRKYRQRSPDVKLVRCALRYINQIEVPETRMEIEDYFTLYAKVPKLPYEDVSGSLVTVQIPQLDIDCMANVTQAFIGASVADHLSFILDIDIFRMGIENWSDTEAWAFLEKLRVRKNEIFEGCITDRARSLFQ